MTTNVDSHTNGSLQATCPPPTTTPADEDVHIDNEQFEDQIRLNNLLEQQKDATLCKMVASQCIIDAPAGPEQGAAEKELKAIALELATIRRRITLLQESVAEMGDLSSLGNVSIVPPAPVVLPAAAEDSVLAKIHPLKVPADAPCFLLGSVSTFVGEDVFEEDCERYLHYLTDVSHIRTSPSSYDMHSLNMSA
ncbi:hypothetical protein BGZ74_004560 [Mortierella antarctica]|nr:hypothetical protein BGZ74_004560 [Mortierella antarctica]